MNYPTHSSDPSGTSSSSGPPSPPFLGGTTYDTYSGHIDSESLFGAQSPLRAAWHRVERLPRDSTTQQARALLIDLQRILNTLDSSYVPDLAVYVDKEGELLLEWALPDFRIGFSIEQDPSQSGWFTIAKPSLGGLVASGDLQSDDLDTVLRELVRTLVGLV